MIGGSYSSDGGKTSGEGSVSASSDNAAGLKSQRERLADMLSANGGS